MSGYFDALNRRRRNLDVTPADVLPAPDPAPETPHHPAPETPRHPAPETPRRLAKPVVEPVTIEPPPPPGEYEALRERLLVAANGTPLKTIVFSDCRGGEGCAEVVLTLARTLATTGLNVLVVDAGRQSPVAPAGMPAPGGDLVELVMTGGSPVASPWGNGRLALVTRGATGPEKEHFLRAAQFGAWMEVQRGAHDYVLLVAPPLLSFADATLIGRVSDGAVIVAQAETTERESLVRAREQLQRAGVKIIGVVLNRARNPIPAFLRPYLPAE